MYSPSSASRDYRYRPDLLSYKIDYAALFTRNLGYMRMSHTNRHHLKARYVEDRYERIAMSVVRRNVNGGR